MNFIAFAVLAAMGVWLLNLRKHIAEVEENAATLTQLEELTARIRRLERHFPEPEAPRPASPDPEPVHEAMPAVAEVPPAINGATTVISEAPPAFADAPPVPLRTPPKNTGR